MSARFALLSLMIVASLLGACSSTSQSKRDEATEILMKPPSPDEDPFFYVARPPVDAKADTRGTIGDSGPPPPSRAPSKVPEARTKGDSSERVLSLETQIVELRAKNLALENQLEQAKSAAAAQARKSKAAAERPTVVTTKPPANKPDIAQCHACVRLCPLKGRCADDAELVCGWGAGKDREDAMLRATTECDGALQSLREGGAFSRIAGTCPAATCAK